MSAELESMPVTGKYYGDKANKYDEKRLRKEAFHNDQFVIQHILRGVIEPGHNLLDIACGTNRISEFIRDLGGKYHGIDISSDMVKLAREKDPQSDIRVADAREIPHPDASFDIIMTVKFLKWIPDDATLGQIVQEISRVMKPGAVAILHQKIAGGAPQPIYARARQAVRSLLGSDTQKQSEIKTRAVEEGTFLDFCTRNGLSLKFSTMTAPAYSMLRKKRLNVFYILQKS